MSKETTNDTKPVFDSGEVEEDEPPVESGAAHCSSGSATETDLAERLTSTYVDDHVEEEDDLGENTTESLGKIGRKAFREMRITDRELLELEAADERFTHVKRRLLYLAVELENHTFASNAFAGAVAALTIIRYYFREYKGIRDFRLVTGYFTTAKDGYKYVYPHIWVETSHRRVAQLWNKMFSDSDPKSTWSKDKQWGEERINRITDICGGTKDVRDAIILGQGVSFGPDSKPLMYHRTKPTDPKTGKEKTFPPGRVKEMMQAEKNNRTIRRNPGGWVSMLGHFYPQGPQIFAAAVRDTIQNDPNTLRLKKTKEEYRKFYEEIGETKKEVQEREQKKHIVDSLGLPEEIAGRIAEGRGTKDDFHAKAEAELATQGDKQQS